MVIVLNLAPFGTVYLFTVNWFSAWPFRGEFFACEYFKLANKLSTTWWSSCSSMLLDQIGIVAVITARKIFRPVPGTQYVIRLFGLAFGIGQVISDVLYACEAQGF